MRPIHSLWLVMPAVLGLAACGDNPPPPTQVIIQQPQTQAVVVPTAPMPPPPPQQELVPPPPPSPVPTIWQPGHWRYTGIAGSDWAWVGGHYVALPPGATAWVPGQWQQQNGGFVWQEGHWS